MKLVRHVTLLWIFYFHADFDATSSPDEILYPTSDRENDFDADSSIDENLYADGNIENDVDDGSSFVEENLYARSDLESDEDEVDQGGDDAIGDDGNHGNSSRFLETNK